MHCTALHSLHSTPHCTALHSSILLCTPSTALTTALLALHSTLHWALHSTPLQTELLLHCTALHSTPRHSFPGAGGTRLNGDMAELLQSTISFGAVVITTAPLSSRRPGADAWSQQRALVLIYDFMFPENSFSWCAAPARGYVHKLVNPSGC